LDLKRQNELISSEGAYYNHLSINERAEVWYIFACIYKKPKLDSPYYIKYVKKMPYKNYLQITTNDRGTLDIVIRQYRRGQEKLDDYR
jgi:hypothetical protein